MVELMQNLIEWNAILDRMALPLEDEPEEVEVTSVDSYDPVDGITFI